VKPPPMASIRMRLPGLMRPSSTATESAKGTDAAEVLPCSAMVVMTRSGAMPSCARCRRGCADWPDAARTSRYRRGQAGGGGFRIALEMLVTACGAPRALACADAPPFASMTRRRRCRGDRAGGRRKILFKMPRPHWCRRLLRPE
jgi:hypothetical protein